MVRGTWQSWHTTMGWGVPNLSILRTFEEPCSTNPVLLWLTHSILDNFIPASLVPSCLLFCLHSGNQDCIHYPKGRSTWFGLKCSCHWEREIVLGWNSANSQALKAHGDSWRYCSEPFSADACSERQAWFESLHSKGTAFQSSQRNPEILPDKHPWEVENCPS